MNLITDINSGKIQYPSVIGKGETEIVTPEFTVEYRYFASIDFDNEENPCFRESKSSIQVEIIQVYDSEGMQIEYSEFENSLSEAIESNTKVD